MAGHVGLGLHHHVPDQKHINLFILKKPEIYINLKFERVFCEKMLKGQDQQV